MQSDAFYGLFTASFRKKTSTSPGLYMEIRPESLLHIASLAKIRLNEQEISGFTDDLNAVLSALDPLLLLPTANVAPCTHAPTLSDDPQASLRDDIVEQRLSPTEIMRNAPDQQDGHFRVPKIVEE